MYSGARDTTVAICTILCQRTHYVHTTNIEDDPILPHVELHRLNTREKMSPFGLWILVRNSMAETYRTLTVVEVRTSSYEGIATDIIYASIQDICTSSIRSSTSTTHIPTILTGYDSTYHPRRR